MPARRTDSKQTIINIMKLVLATLLGAVVTGVGVHFTLAQKIAGKVTKDEVVKIVASSAPYVRDKALIEARISKLEGHYSEILRATRETRDEVISMREYEKAKRELGLKTGR